MDPSQTQKHRVLIAQVESSPDPEINQKKAEAALAHATEVGASIAVFPEYFMTWKRGGHSREDLLRLSQPVDGGFVAGLSEMAASTGIWIVAGMVERAPEKALPYNTIVILDNVGSLVGSYRKSHLFDAFKYRESDSYSRGEAPFRPIETPLGTTGLFVCYELRFPEVARGQALAGATVLVIPSAWVEGPFKDKHWETLLQARAIENGCYVVAAAQAGNEFCGQSLILDPMGVTVAQGSEREDLIVGDIDTVRIAEVRSTVPSLAHRIPELYQPH